MIKDTQDTTAITIEDSASVTQHTDAFASFLSQPVTKLHADEYRVDDLDGVTESLFGSGNMNFLMMQAGQTDEALINATPFDEIGGGNDAMNSNLPYMSASAAVGGAYGNGLGDTMGARSYGQSADNVKSAFGGNGVFSGSASGNGRSSAAGDSSSSALSRSSTNSDSVTATAMNGSNGNSGSNGSNGTNGEGGGDTTTTIINNTTTNNYDIDIIEIDDSVTNIIDNTTDLLTEIVNNTFNTVNNVTDFLTVLTENVFNTINNIFNGDFPGDLGPIGLDLTVVLDDLTSVVLDIFNGNTTIPVLDEILDLSPVTNITDVLADLTGVLGLHLLYDPLQPDTSGTDTDLTVLADLQLPLLPLPPLTLEIPLDGVEGLLGDIDLDLGLTSDLILGLLGDSSNELDHDLGLNLGSAIGNVPLINESLGLVLNPVEDLLGDIDIGITPNIDLFDTSAISNAHGDTDITIPLDINLLGSNLLGETIAIPLDPVEAIVGDIDLDLTAALNLLGQTADALIDGYAGGSAEPNLLSDISGALGGLLSPLLPQTNTNDDSDTARSAALSDDGTNNATGLPMDIAFIDNPLVDNVIAAPLDLVESVVGNMGLNDGTATDLPGSLAAFAAELPDTITDVAGSLLGSLNTEIGTALQFLTNSSAQSGDLNLDALGGLTGGTDFPLWTDSILPNASDLLGSGHGMDLSHILPDPVILAPIVAIITPQTLFDNGLLGGKHFGGLFG